ncbi:M1 family metallopeptidase [Hydrotalea sp.]|uniref:M1 family metallopeptidase n=1 Tax=Hydrotalea sp. TaxID=2881279 RepID=UPI0026213482|nr:M1 family metallopeptidase [Hydrotalea sp.]
MKMQFFLLGMILTMVCTIGQAQNVPQNSAQNGNWPLFAPLNYQGNGSVYRSANGSPAANYWQNRTDYKIEATLDTVQNILTATETITYTNNSPGALNILWIQMDQNTYLPNARSQYYTNRYRNEFTRGFQIASVQITVNGQLQKANYWINDTRMQIQLPQPLSAKGGKVFIHIQYQYQIPGTFGGRTDYVATQYGKIFEIAQWYPRMCVYDDLEGWSTLPFLESGEFYCDYGDYDYSITLPAGMIVAGSGELQNPEEVLTPLQRNRLAKAVKSNQTVWIRTLAEVQQQPALKANKTWHFKMLNTRDIAFGASKAYLWDAAKVNLPSGKKCMAMSVYPVESMGDSAWGRATEYLKKSIEYFSEKYFEYPYPVAINEAGIADGMEYPGIVFDGMNDKGKELYRVTAHEIGHNWFPMIVGSDERRYPWMDEGFNTFIDVYASDVFNKGEYAPKRDGEYAPGGGNPADEIVPYLSDPHAPVMMTRADGIPEKYRHPIVYFKPAYGLVLLCEVILGHERFDAAFKHYIQQWAFKHPAPFDFFNTMNNLGGEDLSWFWKEWFFENQPLDQSIENVIYTHQNPANGIDITLVNLQPMVMPIPLEVEYANGEKLQMQLPVETWLQGNIRKVHIATVGKVKSVKIDPKQLLPDANRNNNVFTMPAL